MIQVSSLSLFLALSTYLKSLLRLPLSLLFSPTPPPPSSPFPLPFPLLPSLPTLFNPLSPPTSPLPPSPYPCPSLPPSPSSSLALPSPISLSLPSHQAVRAGLPPLEGVYPGSFISAKRGGTLRGMGVSTHTHNITKNQSIFFDIKKSFFDFYILSFFL